MSGWLIHIIPVDDIRDHEGSTDCWCEPQQDPDMELLWIHKSADHREETEPLPQ